MLDAVGRQDDHDALQQSFASLNNAAFGCGVIESVTPVIQVVGGLAGVGLGAAALLGVSASALTVPLALVGIITFQTGAALWGVGHLVGQDTPGGAVLVQEGQSQIIHLAVAGVAKLAGTGLLNLIAPGLGERLIGAYGLIEGSKVLLSLSETNNRFSDEAEAAVDEQRGDSAGATAISLDQFVALNDELAALVRARVPLERTLSELGRDVPGTLGETMRLLATRMGHGETLAQAIAAERERLLGRCSWYLFSLWRPSSSRPINCFAFRRRAR